MSPIAPERLQELEEAIFVQGCGTVEEAAAAYSRDDLMTTIRAARGAMRDAVLGLPSQAFDEQPAGEEGEREWSAGEIVGHIAESMLWLQFALRRLAGENPEGQPADTPEIAVRDRDETLALLDRADRELDLALALARDLDDDISTHIDAFGDVGVRGLLLLHAMHEWEHARQMAALQFDS